MTPQPPVRYKRKLRNMLIYPRFQLSLVGIHAAIVVSIMATVWLRVDMAFQQLESSLLESGIPGDSKLFQFVGLQQEQLLVALLVVFAGGLILSSLITLYLSFKLAGPIYGLKRHLRRLCTWTAEDPIPSLNFRRWDFFADLPPVVNQLSAHLFETGLRERQREAERPSGGFPLDGG